MGHYCLLGESVEKALREALKIRQDLRDERIPE
jgi:hypothetical protein